MDFFGALSKVQGKYYYSLAGIVLLILIYLLTSWFGGGGDRESLETVRGLPTVSAREVVLQKRLLVKRFIGSANSLSVLDLRSMVDGRVKAIHVSKNDRVEPEGVLISLGVEDRKEELERAQAALKEAELEFKAVKSLREEGYRSESKFYAALSKLKSAGKGVVAAKEAFGRSEIKAPFSGVVYSIPVEKGDLVSSYSTVVASIYDPNHMLAEVFIPEKAAYSLKGALLNQEVNVMTIDDRVLKGRIRSLASDADSNTKSHKLVVDLLLEPGEVVYLGATLEMHLAVSEHQAYYVDNYALGINENMEVVLKALDADNRVSFIPVVIVDEDNSGRGFWVEPKIADSAQKIRIITYGQGYATAGAKVEVGEEPFNQH